MSSDTQNENEIVRSGEEENPTSNVVDGLLSPSLSIIKSHYSRFNFRAATGGVFIALGVIFLAHLISGRIEGAGLSGFISETATSIFLGASTGHFFGKALRNEGDLLNSFLVGGSLTIALSLLSMVGLTLVGGVLLVFAIGVFFMHNSGLVEEDEAIRGYVELFSERFSAYALGLIAALKYLWPLAESLLAVLAGVV